MLKKFLSNNGSKIKAKLFRFRINYFSAITSTQNLAKELAKKKAPEGTLIIAEKQSAGRGRFKRHWVSPPGGLWFSFILYPEILPAKIPLITLTSALSVAKAIERVIQLKPKIKWPNDVYVQGKKVCGILTEAGWKDGRPEWVVVGIGVNVHNPIPPELRNKAAALSEFARRKIYLEKLLQAILRQLERYYFRIKRGEETNILKEIKKYSYLLGKTVEIKFNNHTIQGKVSDLDEDGALLISTNQGVEKIISGEITSID